MKRTETPRERIDRLANTPLHRLTLAEVAELHAHVGTTSLAATTEAVAR